MDRHAHLGKCSDAVEWLHHFLDGELDDVRMSDVRAHLDTCLSCLEAFDFEAELRALVARKCRDTVPDAVRIRIVTAIQAEYRSVEGPGGMSPL